MQQRHQYDAKSHKGLAVYHAFELQKTKPFWDLCLVIAKYATWEKCWLLETWNYKTNTIFQKTCMKDIPKENIYIVGYCIQHRKWKWYHAFRLDNVYTFRDLYLDIVCYANEDKLLFFRVMTARIGHMKWEIANFSLDPTYIRACIEIDAKWKKCSYDHTSARGLSTLSMMNLMHLSVLDGK